MPKFFAASDEDIASGRTTDIYFERTVEVLRSKGFLDLETVSEFTVGGLPEKWGWGVLCGTEELIRLLEGRKIDLYGLPEGAIFKPRTQDGLRTPVLRIEGPYGQYCELESPALGFICFSSGVATMAARCKLASCGRTVMSFGVRRMHPSLAPVIDRASFIGGCDSVSSILGAETIGQEPSGTMPHSLVVMMGDQKSAFQAFDAVVDGKVRRVALVDTYYDEKVEAIIACENVKDLYAVRLDTPGSRRGSLPDIVREVRWEMDLRGYHHVKIFVSGGLSEGNLRELVEAGVDGFGIGTSISNAPTIDFSMDIVEKEGRPVAKRGKLSGRKFTFRCDRCLNYGISTSKKNPPKCNRCGESMTLAEVKILSKGRRVKKEEPTEVIRDRVIDQTKCLEL